MKVAAQTLAVCDKWTGETIEHVPIADAAMIDSALARATCSVAEEWPARARSDALHTAGALLDERRDELLTTMVRETGFTRRDAEDEYARARVTLELSAQEALRITGEPVALAASSGFDDRLAFTVRAPIGVVLAITPFNTPVNGVLHKVAPALAAGNAAVLKPAEVTPLSAAIIVRALHEAGVPEDRLHLLNGTGEAVGLPLLRDERVSFTTFTGSTPVGEIVKSETGVRPVALELGSIAATLVCPDADLESAATLIARGGYRKAGQVCTSVQRVFVDRAVADELTGLLLDTVRALRAGDPADEASDLGPVIGESAAARIVRMIGDSADAGAELLAGGSREGSLVAPTLLAGVEEYHPVALREAFGPLVAITATSGLDDSIARVNAGRFGLQAGVFTSSVATALRCARSLQAGGVIVNGTSSTRADGMPFGGQKDSGFGKEGPAYAARAMTVERLVVLGG